MLTLTAALNQLGGGQLGGLGDTLVQRLKSFEAGLDVHGHLGKELELVGQEQLGLMTTEERLAAQNAISKQSRLRTR